MSSYPALNIRALSHLAVIRENMQADPNFLDDSPYDEDTRALLRKVFPTVVEDDAKVELSEHQGAQKRGRKNKRQLDDEQLDEVEKEAKALLDDLRKMKVEPRLDTASKLNIMKLQTTLMEKIISIRDKASNIRQQSKFQSDVMEILEDLMDDDKRAEFIQRMEAFL